MAERTTVIGRLGREPSTRSTPKGEVTGFSLAQSSRTLGPDGRWSDGPTTWYEVSAWDGLAANAVASLHKGQPVIVHGVVFTHEWTGRDGATRSELRIRAVTIGHDLSSGTASFERAPRAAAAVPAEAAGPAEPAAETSSAPAPAPAAAAAAPAAWSDPADGWHTLAHAEGDTPF